MEFKVGDKVKVLREFEGNTHCIGWVGTVIFIRSYIYSESKTIYVKFDQKFKNGHGSDGYGIYGYCWNYDENCLELVNGMSVELI